MNILISTTIALSLFTFSSVSGADPTPPSKSNVVMKPVIYRDSSPENGAELEGMVSYNPNIKGKVPGVLVIHEWTGLDDYTQMRIQQIAALGYVVFAADIYGKGIRPKDPKDAAATSSIYKNNRPLLRRRARLALEQLKKQPNVDPSKIVVMGYCFGGGATLELARDGADALGFISFHGNLDTPTPNDAKNIKGEVLVLHGADDPYVPQKDVAAFETEMKNAHVKYQLVQYPGAVHGFTNPAHGTDPKAGAAYNKEADLKSWSAMKAFMSRLFAKK